MTLLARAVVLINVQLTDVQAFKFGTIENACVDVHHQLSPRMVIVQSQNGSIIIHVDANAQLDRPAMVVSVSNIGMMTYANVSAERNHKNVLANKHGVTLVAVVDASLECRSAVVQ